MRKSFISAALLFCGLFSYAQDNAILFPSFKTREGSVKVGVLLPLEGDSQSKANNLDFYCGVLEAARVLGNEGYDISLETHDIAKENFAVQALNGYDFIVGPVKSEDLEQVVTTLGDSTCVISPLDRKADNLAKTHRLFIQAAPCLSLQWNEMVRWALEDKRHRPLNFIVIGNSNEYETAQSVKATIAEETSRHLHNIKINGCHCGVSNEIEGWHGVYDSTSIHDNIVIVASVNEAVLNNAVRNLAILGKNYPMEVYCPAKVHSYSTINVEDLHKAGVRCVCPYYVDYRDDKVRDFSKSFRRHFNGRPTQFAFQGYDLMYHSVKSFCAHGRDWASITDSEGCDRLLQANFQYRRLPEGGLMNSSLRRLEYSKDLHLILHTAE